MKDFFAGGLLEEFRNNPKIRTALNGGELMNYAELMEWFSLRSDKSEKRKSSQNGQHVTLMKHFKSIAHSACEKQIGDDYAEKAMNRVLDYDEFDMIVIVAPHWDKLKRDEFSVGPEASFKRKLNHILGFMIVEKGECKKMPTAYSINLICTRTKILEYKRYSNDRGKERERTRGGILLGFYLYCSKKHGQTHGILELADGYMNTSGFFSYSKQGFIKDLTMFGINCFNDQANLPMSVRLDKYTFDEIMNHASGDKSVEIKTADIDDDTGLIKLVPRTETQKNLQKEYANYCQMTYQLPYVLSGYFKYDKGFVLDRPLIKINTSFVSKFKKENDNNYPESDDYLTFFQDKMSELRNKFNEVTPMPTPAPTPAPTPSTVTKLPKSRNSRKSRKTAKAHIEAVQTLRSRSKTRSNSRAKTGSKLEK
jgi:hypothetical protein